MRPHPIYGCTVRYFPRRRRPERGEWGGIELRAQFGRAETTTEPDVRVG